MSQPLNERQLIDRARAVLTAEADAITALIGRLGTAFTAACRLLNECEQGGGRVIVTGMGKSGHVGTKIAATLASTGTPAFFLHAAEASHGDIGMIRSADLVLALSNSGETTELITILPAIKRLDARLIAMTGVSSSTLARAADVVLDVSVSAEACPLNLAPTTSTTATLALGDALAVAMLEARGFTSDDFARSHPGGNLGQRRLLKHVEDVMRRDERVPQIEPGATLRAALAEISSKGLGMTAVVDGRRRLLGVFTDGDLRRQLTQSTDLDAITIDQVMNRTPQRVRPHMLAAEAVHVMETKRITALPVVDGDDVLIGALNVHDLFHAGVM
jgi:arabinose-5-phosphate isomerase